MMKHLPHFLVVLEGHALMDVRHARRRHEMEAVSGVAEASLHAATDRCGDAIDTDG